MMSYSPSVGALAILRFPLFSPMRTWGNTATSIRVWGGGRVRRPRLRRLALFLRPWTPLTINIYCVTAVVLSLQRAKVMHLPEFTAVGKLGFARWIRSQHGSNYRRILPPQNIAHHGSPLNLNPQPTGRTGDTHSSGDSRPSRGHPQVSTNLNLKAHRPAHRHSQKWRTCQSRHSRNTSGSGPAPTPGSNPRLARLGCTPTGASAFAAPQPSTTTQGLSDSDARPQGPLHSRRHSLRQSTQGLSDSDARPQGPLHSRRHSLRQSTQGLRDSDTRPQGPLHSQCHSLRSPGRPSNAQ
jgi:hypothetical protein